MKRLICALVVLSVMSAGGVAKAERGDIGGIGLGGPVMVCKVDRSGAGVGATSEAGRSELGGYCTAAASSAPAPFTALVNGFAGSGLVY